MHCHTYSRTPGLVGHAALAAGFCVPHHHILVAAGRAGMATLAIALLTVSIQAIKAALMNPVKALKTE